MDGLMELLTPAEDAGSLRGLQFVHRLVSAPPQDALDELLSHLAEAWAGRRAALADLTTGALLGGAAESPWPWQQRPELLETVATAHPAVALRHDDTSWLLTAAASGERAVLLGVEASGDRAWTQGEAGALALAAQALARSAVHAADPAWLRQARRRGQQQRLEQIAQVTRRLAHDYGNTLTGILGFAELVRAETDESHPLAAYLDEIYKAGQQGAQLTNQLRLYARRSWPPTEPTRLADAVEAEVRRLRDRTSHGLQFEMELPAELPGVPVGFEALRAILGPLFQNAVEAMPQGGRVRVCARSVALSAADCADLLGPVSPGEHVELTVEDEGPGLAAAAEGRLFVEPFYSTKPRRGGLGLGTVYGILQCHRGGLALGAGPGGGTVARVYLPAAPAAPPASTKPQKILVVDDDPMILQFVCATLERAGYAPRPAGSGDEALRHYGAARGEPFGLVLADVMMPGMSGFELVRRLLSQDASVNVLFMSGHITHDVGRHDVPGQSFALLTKPFRPDGLLQAVRTALDQGPRRSPSPPPRRGEEALLTPSPVMTQR